MSSKSKCSVSSKPRYVYLSTMTYDNSTTDNWPTRQLSDSNFSPTTNSPPRPLADTTSHRQFFLKTHRHSPTLTDRAFPRKRDEKNFFQGQYCFIFGNEHIHHFAFNTQTNGFQPLAFQRMSSQSTSGNTEIPRALSC